MQWRDQIPDFSDPGEAAAKRPPAAMEPEHFYQTLQQINSLTICFDAMIHRVSD
ncbi:hypothetical protein FY145_25870 (plasmid) [Agrobacterium tumefaciens]|uniref:hypothetical protein n=1 Tax=Agrobacterium tumefaciens TaxID=358 RepID=UPI0021CE740B|nr:hypothetical protein [Agrobacterium tumefaciens]UXS73973.1 hypothetical protein FY146_25860 [Agrobacterium tumefaciens]UXS81638.1 hypothetical protein FY145_25870 [Agrobacterium tumefaciens]UXT52820.1 hypothetical protein FY136_26565 [Agrobacterium tumefaciens]